MKKQYFFILFVLLLISGCRSGNDQPPEQETGSGRNEPPYYMELEDVPVRSIEASLSTITDEIEYIPLETNRRSLLHSIYDILVMENDIIISDFYQLYRFDWQGKFLGTIGGRGAGPGEYNYASYLFFDRTDPDKFYQKSSWKVNQYTREGTFVKSISMNFPEANWYSSGIMFNDSLLLMNTGRIGRRQQATDSILYHLHAIDMNGTIRKRYVDHSPLYIETGAVLASQAYSLYARDSVVRYKPYENDTIFTVTPDSMQVYAILHLGKMKTNHNPDFSRTQSNQQADEVVDALSNKLSIWRIYEDDRFLYPHVTWGVYPDKEKGSIYCLYEKATGTFLHISAEGLTNDLDGSLPFYPRIIQPGGEKINWMEASDFKDRILHSGLDTSHYLHQLATSLREDDNPVLIIARSKNEK